MVTITIPNVPDELQRRIEGEARRSGRSVDQEVVVILNKALRVVPPVRLPEPTKPLREVTAQEIVEGIREGRE
jgi:plasmid stability protein